MSDRLESTNFQEKKIVEQDSLEEKKLRFEWKKEKWHILSNILTVLITVGIGTYGVAHINNVYQERQLKREQILKEKEIEILEKKADVERQKAEMQYLGQFLEHALVEDVNYRHRFAEYFANVTLSPELKKGWKGYLTNIIGNKEELDKKESLLFSSGGLMPAKINDQEQEQLIRDIVTLRSKVDSLQKPQRKISDKIIGQTIFKIQCSSGQRIIQTTGFRLEGEKGIITALHAVVGCKHISALGDDIHFVNMQLIKADIAHDVALLSSKEVQTLKFDGLRAAGSQPSYEGLYLVGYPLSLLNPFTTHINIRTPPIIELWKLLPKELRTMLNKRKSPSVKKNVLSLEGNVLPGQSGAPLLNGENTVVGIINGGLDVGTGISWAIPLEDIQWTSVSEIREELVRLSHSGSLL